MECIVVDEKQKWNTIVQQFNNWDIYYLNEYARALQIHGDGIPFLIVHEEGENKIAYVVLQQDISVLPYFTGNIASNQYFDWTTPYGYGGPLIQGDITEDWMRDFVDKLTLWCKQHKIITQFLRFHPLLNNQQEMTFVSDVISQKKVVYIDTTSKEIIWKNMTPNNRNMVRKAEKNEISIFHDTGQYLDVFLEIYEGTMRMHDASDYYLFPKEYFKYLIEEMNENVVFFYAKYQEKIISASMFFYNEKFMHYHLSGTLPEYRKLASANMLLTKAAEWAAEHGISMMHLGGGLRNEDSLLDFKKHFNRNGMLDFFIGRNIFDKQKYKELVQIRKKTDSGFDDKQNYLILYRG